MAQAAADRSGFVVHGLAAESAAYDAESRGLRLSSELSSSLPTIILRWVRTESSSRGADGQAPSELVSLPLYLTRERKNLVCSVKMPTYGVPAHTWYQRGVALFA